MKICGQVKEHVSFQLGLTCSFLLWYIKKLREMCFLLTYVRNNTHILLTYVKNNVYNYSYGALKKSAKGGNFHGKTCEEETSMQATAV